MVTGKGTPLAIEVSAGETRDSKVMYPVIERAVVTLVGTRRRRIKPRKLAGDKDYSVRKNREWLKAQGSSR